jgi:hypothetical protein
MRNREKSAGGYGSSHVLSLPWWGEILPRLCFWYLPTRLILVAGDELSGRTPGTRPKDQEKGDAYGPILLILRRSRLKPTDFGRRYFAPLCGGA